eukprot:CAMPEP_0114546920 /NCGR_PEP_ID=MMETSP0114-20121206/4188_1 /TAXON_ID=31324 /ORGANISM="Goniomonas sp, Strain m" /LENGTH=140 /DNA_ID=CAMNT_0001731441 /DNA_START=198 /DNA_END=620 /DNA_ORIENTATION=-
MPTVGVELDEIVFQKAQFSIREIGGSFVPVWPRYFDDCKQLFYMVDVANPPQLAISTIEFMNVLTAKEMQGKPVTLLLNKTDLPHTLSTSEISSLMRLDDIRQSLEAPLRVFEISSFTDAGVQLVLDELLGKTGKRSKQD